MTRGSAHAIGADASELAARLGEAPAAGLTRLDQETVDVLVALIDREGERRGHELERELPAALANVPWPMRRLVGNMLLSR